MSLVSTEKRCSAAISFSAPRRQEYGERNAARIIGWP